MFTLYIYDVLLCLRLNSLRKPMNFSQSRTTPLKNGFLNIEKIKLVKAGKDIQKQPATTLIDLNSALSNL